MTTEQQKQLLDLEITLPKEYNFGKLGDEDFEKIVLSREKGQSQDIPHIRYTIKILVPQGEKLEKVLFFAKKFDFWQKRLKMAFLAKKYQISGKR
jgi:hypothetical protein